MTQHLPLVLLAALAATACRLQPAPQVVPEPEPSAASRHASADALPARAPSPAREASALGGRSLNRGDASRASERAAREEPRGAVPEIAAVTPSAPEPVPQNWPESEDAVDGLVEDTASELGESAETGAATLAEENSSAEDASAADFAEAAEEAPGDEPEAAAAELCEEGEAPAGYDPQSRRSDLCVPREKLEECIRDGALPVMVTNFGMECTPKNLEAGEAPGEADGEQDGGYLDEGQE